MSDVVYTASAEVTGGRDNGHGRTSDGALEVELQRPTKSDGAPDGTNPEQLFAIGYAACFASALRAAAREQQLNADDLSINSEVSLLRTPERRSKLAVELDVMLPSVKDRDVAVELVRDGHQRCPYSNATRGNIDVTLTANGVPVSAGAGA